MYITQSYKSISPLQHTRAQTLPHSVQLPMTSQANHHGALRNTGNFFVAGKNAIGYAIRPLQLIDRLLSLNQTYSTVQSSAVNILV